MNKYLIVIDMQNDFVNGALGTKEALKIVPKVKAKIEAYRKLGDKIIFTRDTHQKDYLSSNEGKHLPFEHCIENTDGWQICDEINTEGGEIINKPSFGFIEWEKFIDNNHKLSIELIGLCTDICVVSNAIILKALFPEADIKVDSNACAGVTPETHKSALETMKMCQIEII